MLLGLWMVAHATAIQYDQEGRWLPLHEPVLELEVVDRLRTSLTLWPSKRRQELARATYISLKEGFLTSHKNTQTNSELDQ